MLRREKVMITINKSELEAAERFVKYVHEMPRTGKTEREQLVNCVKQASHADAVSGLLSALGLEAERDTTTKTGWRVFAPIYRKHNQSLIRTLLEGYKAELETWIAKEEIWLKSEPFWCGLPEEKKKHRRTAEIVISNTKSIIYNIDSILENEV